MQKMHNIYRSKQEGRDQAEHPHLGAQGQGLHLRHQVESDRQEGALHPSHREVQLVHKREVIYPVNMQNMQNIQYSICRLDEAVAWVRSAFGNAG